MERYNPLIRVEDDNLYIDEVRSWSKKKYKLVGAYCEIFSTGMKFKWENLIYIDLFAGSGYSKIKNTNEIYKNSALIALSVPNKFSKYILCEKNSKKYNALQTRINRDYSNLNITPIEGDCNKNIDKIIEAIPLYSKENKVLSFCFVDPYSINFDFLTISKLGTKIVDFLILQALHMDPNRNFGLYYKQDNKKIERYLGNPNWREEFDSKDSQNIIRFLADQYQKQMINLGYLNKKEMHQIRSDDRGLPLYYLSFYSKNTRGIDFFKKVEKRCTSQTSLDF